MIAALTPQDLGVPAGTLVLDIGCADGQGSVRLSAHGYDVLGVELEAQLVDRLVQQGAGNVLSACRGDATNLPFATSSIPAAVMIEVLEHIPDTGRSITELARVLMPGGRYCVAVPTEYTERVFARLHPRYLSNAEHLHRFDRRQLVELFEQQGLHVERVATRNLAPAAAWIVHALLRTDADATGKVLHRGWIDRGASGLLYLLRRIPLLRSAVGALEQRVGKSWYLYGTRA